jgi:hypothetical protein
VVLQVRDPNAGGAAGDDVIFVVLTGTPAAVPAAPSIPDTAISLATVLVPAAAASIVNANITDTRTKAVAGIPLDLGNITDVDITSVTDGDILQYDSGAGEWQNVAAEIDRLVDVTITSVKKDDTLHYDGSSWINRKPADPFLLMGA